MNYAMKSDKALTWIAVILFGILAVLIVDAGHSNKSVADRFADGVNDITDSITGKTPAEKIGDSVDDIVDQVKQ